MAFDVDEGTIKRAKGAHELFMVNLGMLLLLGPLAIFLGIGRLAVLLPMGVTALFVFYFWRRVNSAGQTWFVQAHWRLALHNYRFLAIGFALTVVMLLISWVVSITIDHESPSRFLAVALTRIGVMPTIIMVFACFVIENGALNMALRSELPQKIVDRFPPPSP